VPDKEVNTKESKLEAKNENAKQSAQAKIEKETMKNKVTEQVEPAVIKTNKRRRYPFIKLLIILLCMALAGGYVWQYRQKEIDKKILTIQNLKEDAKAFAEQQKVIEEEKKALESKFSVLETDTFTIRVPSTWSLRSTQFPQDETVIGDQNTTMRVINSETRNSIANFIPTVDFLWQIGEENDNLKVSRQSRHCQGFDTINNDFSEALREHNGFNVYCDKDGGKVVVGAMSKPESYGTENTNTYFIIEINDVQQVNFDEIAGYIESFVSNR